MQAANADIDAQDHLKAFYWLANRIRQPGDPFDANDLVHDCWPTLVKMCRQFRPGRMPLAKFLFHFGGRILRTKRQRRKFRSWQPIPSDDQGHPLVEPVSDRPGPGQEMIQEENRQHLYRFLLILPPLDRQAVELFFGLGDQPELTLEEIGKSLGVSKQRAQQRVQRGLHRLRQALQEP